MKRLGYYKGEIKGGLDKATLRALEEWILVKNFENKMRKDRYVLGKHLQIFVGCSRSLEPNYTSMDEI